MPTDKPVTIREAWADLKELLDESGLYDEFNDFCGAVVEQLPKCPICLGPMTLKVAASGACWLCYSGDHPGKVGWRRTA